MNSRKATTASPEVAAILSELKALGTPSYKKVMLNHGVTEPIFGVKISELQKIRKRLRKQYELALGLYATRIYDAMYLAGLVADEKRMTKADLQLWLDTATHDPIASYVVSSPPIEAARSLARITFCLLAGPLMLLRASCRCSLSVMMTHAPLRQYQLLAPGRMVISKRVSP